MKITKKSIVISLLCCSFTQQLCASTENHLSDKVNPFIGACNNVDAAGVFHGLGKTFPGATTPFGMVQVSPNTVTGGDNGPGYSYEHSTIEGFAFTQMSGIGWYGDLGNFLVMPTTGPLFTNSGKENGRRGYRSYYDKKTETASPGYYKVYLTDYKIKAETTAAPHSGMLRFTFPKSQLSRIQIDLARRVGGTSVFQDITVVDSCTISGKMVCTPDGGGWGNGVGKADYVVYYYAQFSKPLKKYGVWEVDIPMEQERKLGFVESDYFQELTSAAKIHKNITSYKGRHIGFFSEFETKENEEVLLRAGISFVSTEGAKKNLEAEMTTWNFDVYKNQSKKLWDDALAKIQVDGGSLDQQTVFYTSLYRTMIDPRSVVDVDGKYVGGDKKVHQTSAFTKRSIFSGWDVFRSQIPLQTIINPDLVNDLVHSLLTLAHESNSEYFERWEFLNAYSGCMIGNPAISVLLDAYVKGITDVNIQDAYEVAKKTCKLSGNSKYGYVPNSISETLEYAYSEWCMSRLAELLGKKKDYKMYKKLANSYQNIYDKEKHSFRPKKKDGSFSSWPKYGKLDHNHGCVECNELQQGWFVPHDICGMTKIMGGKERVIADLDSMFLHTPLNFMWNDYYNHANEPVHHVPFLYNALGEPWKTQKWVRTICNNAYKNRVDGLVGNEDVGQMSAWYVLASCGIHPICPGKTTFEICSPLFENVKIKVGDTKYFIIKAYNNSDKNMYIQSVKLNGHELSDMQIEYKDIMNGGLLELHMGESPVVH